MGRRSGYLALMAGIAGGTEVIALPEVDLDPASVAQALCAAYDRGKSHAIAVIAEGAKYNADSLMHYFHEHRERLGFELRVTKLGHVQRGGTPGVFDRMLGTLLGVAAVDAAVGHRYGMLIGMRDGAPASTPLAEVAGRTKPADTRLLELAHVMAM
jgi:6-phosphofructokinase 1